MIQLKNEIEEIRIFIKNKKCGLFLMTVVMILIYGIRAVHDNFYIDSEIMFQKPELMDSLWLGSNRFGLVFIEKIFGMGRLIPYFSGSIMLLFMCLAGIALSYASWKWCGCKEEYKGFVILFPILALTAPVFAEQFLFILQAFEIGAGYFLVVCASYCMSKAVYGSEKGKIKGPWNVWIIPGLFCLVLSWGVYQVYVPLYITLVLVSFVLVYLNGNPKRAFEYGIRHILLFFIGCLTYMILVKAVRIAVHTDSTYVSDLIHWKTEGMAAGIQAIITTMMRAAIGHGVFYRKWYAPAMLLFCIQCMYLGWKKKKSLVDYGIFLISGILLALSPFYLTILSGAVQSVRTEMVYPVAAALFLAHLTVWPENGRKWEKWKTAAISLVCVVCIIQQGAVTLQLFQSSLEAYRNDVLTMTQMYPKICEAADTEDMSQCKVIFLGKKSANLHGPVVYGELCGHSFFEPEATSALGVTGRVAPVFGILGMDMQAIREDEKELYDQAVLLMEEAPSWPVKGSIQKLDENVVAVKLSGDRF